MQCASSTATTATFPFSSVKSCLHSFDCTVSGEINTAIKITTLFYCCNRGFTNQI